MEAALPLRPPSVRTVGDRVAVDGLVVDDAVAVRLVHEREEAGEDPARLLLDAIEIGARVLDREQAGANAEFVRTEFEKQAREVETAFGERAGAVAEQLARQLEAAFAPETGVLPKTLQRHFSEESATAVQHRVRALVEEALKRSQHELVRELMRDMARQQGDQLRAMVEKLGALEVKLERAQAEAEKQAELEAERDRGTAKGRTYEEAVFEALDAIAAAQGDDCDAVGDIEGGGGKTGDVVVDIEGCRGAPRGRIVFEAKDARLSKPRAIETLDQALAQRSADFAVLVVSGEDKLPARTTALREYGGDKLMVAFDPDEGPLALEVAYALARARVLMARADTDDLDAAALREAVDAALATMDGVKAIKSSLTAATTKIGDAQGSIEALATRVREQLREIAAALDAALAATAPEQRRLDF
ncbi:MAG: hypothetical protein ACJ76T_14935 [Solirubrobacteraceae bacterium]